MKTEKTLINVNKGQDAYSVIGNYISNHITAIEDMIAVIQIDGCIINELYMVDMETDGYFYWESDWWEGEEDVALVDFFPVSEAERPQEWIPVSERLPEDEYVLISKKPSKISGDKWCVTIAIRMADPRSKKVQWRDIGFGIIPDDKILAWRPLLQPYKVESEEV